MNPVSDRPRRLFEIAETSESLEDFGLLLRDWIHTITRSDVSNRPALAQAISTAPKLLKERFPGGEIADAYLAAYAEWIADQAGINRPEWSSDSRRVLDRPWFADSARASLLILAPASFRQRGIFTVPEQIVRLRRGRPRVSEEIKREKARRRNQRYREKTRRLIQLGRQAIERTGSPLDS